VSRWRGLVALFVAAIACLLPVAVAVAAVPLAACSHAAVTAAYAYDGMARSAPGDVGGSICAGVTGTTRSVIGAFPTASGFAAEDGVNLIGAPDAFDPASLTGETSSEVEARIPSDWVRTPSKSGGGEVFSDPANPGRQIRIMPGYGAGVRPGPLTAGPYAVVSQNGVVTKVPLAGNPTLP
jgi:hypothetical protein